MDTLQHLEFHERRVTGDGDHAVPVAHSVDISDLQIADEQSYRVLVHCGRAFIPCNDPSTSPPLTPQSATTVQVMKEDTDPVVIAVYPLDGVTKVNL